MQARSRRRLRELTLVVIFTVISSALAGAADLEPLLKEAGIQGGLAVHIGASDGDIEARLTNNGRVLVHALALDDLARDKARATLAERGLTGLASVVTWHDRGRLPYADNLVNRVVLDRDALGSAAPTAEEVLRVVAPYGVVIEYQDCVWRKTVKPRPEAMDDWTHFDYGPQGGTCSNDAAVGPARQLQWITQSQPNPFEGNPAGYDPGAGLRVWQRYAVLDINDAYAAPANARKPDMWSLQCRDAFNGTPLWTIRRGRDVGPRTRRSKVSLHSIWTAVLPFGKTRTSELSAVPFATRRAGPAIAVSGRSCLAATT